jgi:hypothetical protein
MNVIIDYDNAKKLNQDWTQNYISNSTRTFIIKLHNNTLPYNTVLSHFVPNISRNCTFCDLSLNNEEEEETPLHLFYSCFTTEQILTQFYSILTNRRNFVPSRNEMFIGFNNVNERSNKILGIVNYLTLHYLWECKLRKVLPNLSNLCKNVKHEIITLKSNSNAFSLWCNSCEIIENLDRYINVHF